MTYTETTDWLFSQLPNYQLQGGSAYKPGLENTLALLQQAGNPEKNLRFIHIAGTNGKGSVSHMLASIFMANGYKTGLFTSPHLHDFRERIKINGRMISEDFVVRFVEHYKRGWSFISPSFFEITAAMAFAAFNENKCDICIIETGLGGRLDSTNVITPHISIITNIGFDHTAFLGDTLEKIAFEKAGIIKEKVPVVIGETTPETKAVFEKIAAEKKAPVYFAPAPAWVETDLAGSFQQKNASTVMTAVRVLQEIGFTLDNEKTAEGLRNVSVTTSFSGRFQKLHECPAVIVDAAHNADGVKILFAEILQMPYEKLHMVYGAANDKDIDKIAKLFPKDAVYYFSEFDSKRTVKTEDFEELANRHGLQAEFFSHSGDAIAAAYENAGERDLIVVFGSFYLIQEVLPRD
jgi:dihydrofolate synthase / folylpolyglutamate synthase